MLVAEEYDNEVSVCCGHSGLRKSKKVLANELRQWGTTRNAYSNLWPR